MWLEFLLGGWGVGRYGDILIWVSGRVWGETLKLEACSASCIVGSNLAEPLLCD
jgi:hypothetical protein